MTASSYSEAGVRGQGDALSSIERHLGPTLSLPPNAELLTRFGQYASVLKVSADLAIAISTDGVGSKTIVASALERYDTIGFDCVAMNVNDVVCVGARPVAMVDYLGVHTLDARRTADVLRGLAAAAHDARIAIPGGELAQLPEVIGANGDERAFDLVGACVGVVHPRRVLTGAAVTPGDALVGLESSGIHSNGLTLARRVLLGSGAFRLDERVAELGGTVGDALLEPTRIYVRAVVDLLDAGADVRGLVHVTGDGFANLCRLDAPVGFDVDELPPAPPVFELVRRTGGIDDAEMYRVFNMGVGFVVVVPAPDADAVVARLAATGYRARRIGTVTDDRRGEVAIRPAGVAGRLAGGDAVFRPL
ncbi:MAG TPA: phosphoribosylformylglycinamidine cyclo-ligase [Actinomycetota bacterium]|nr:phosphoribosylformylglycinamidine cyclo-ligase [Actinomycetota bacterium]